MKIRRLKYLVGINQTALDENTDPDYEFRYIDIGSVGRGALVELPETVSFSEAPSRARRVVRTGDTIISTVRTYLRAVWSVHGATDDLVVSTGFAVLTPGPDLDRGYLGWLAQSDLVVEAVVSRSVGVSYPAINASEIGDIEVPLPTLEQQRATADYLDAETARIDALIEKKESMLVLLAERRRQFLTSEMCSMGFEFPSVLEPNWSSVPLPSGWRVMHLNQCLRQLTNGFVGPTRDILRDEGVPYIQSLHIKSGYIDFKRSPYYVTVEWHRQRPRIHLLEGDVLIVQTGDIGQVAVVPTGFGEASCHALQIARVRADVITGLFLGEYLRTPFAYKSLLSRATGALHPHLEGGIRDTPIVVPPLDVQSALVEKVQDSVLRSESLESVIQSQLRLLVEHRQALITATVTGQFPVPGIAA